jgi:hypothetical protein
MFPWISARHFNGALSRMPWRLEAYEFVEEIVIASLTDGTVRIAVMANVELRGATVVLARCHIDGSGPNRLGQGRLRSLAKWVKEYRCRRTQN